MCVCVSATKERCEDRRGEKNGQREKSIIVKKENLKMHLAGDSDPRHVSNSSIHMEMTLVVSGYK